jgi:hypothetical protein
VLIPAMLLGLALANPSPSPAATDPPPVTICSCLAGISIGDDATAALAKVGSRPLPAQGDSVLSDFESYPGWMLVVYYAKSVVSIAIEVLPPGAPTKQPDPFGVALGDSADRLTALRGKPDAVDGKLWRYGPANGVGWIYSIVDGAVARIAVTSMAPT